jgi:hypothetical protein
MAFPLRAIGMHALTIATAVVLPLRAAAGQSDRSGIPDSALQRGRRLTGSLLDGRIDSLYPLMARPFQASIGERAGLTKFVKEVRALGPAIGIPREAVYRENGTTS